LSDLDLFILTERDLTSIYGGPAIVFFCEDNPIDVETWSPKMIEETTKRAHYCAERIADPRYAFNLTIKELDLLHRLAIGKPLLSESVFRPYQQLAVEAPVSQLLFARSESLIDTLQQDIVGHLNEEDAESAQLLAQRLVGATFDCLTATLGNSNSNEKWRLAKISRLQQSDLDGLIVYTPFQSIREVALYFLTFRGDTECSQYCSEAILLANTIVPWCQAHMAGQRLDSSIRSGASRFEPGDVCLGCLDFLVQIRYENDSLTVSHIRKKTALSFNVIAHELLLCFDGKTSVRAAIELMSAKTNCTHAEMARSVQDMISVLDTHGFIESQTDIPLKGKVEGLPVHAVNDDFNSRTSENL